MIKNCPKKLALVYFLVEYTFLIIFFKKIKFWPKILIFLIKKTDSYQSNIHEIDTRQNTALTVFDGTQEDDSKLAKQFWNSFALVPPVESTLVCKEIHQRIRTRTTDDNKPKRNYVHFYNSFVFIFFFLARFSTTTTTKTKVKEEKSIKSQIMFLTNINDIFLVL